MYNIVVSTSMNLSDSIDSVMYSNAIDVNDHITSLHNLQNDIINQMVNNARANGIL
jgi:hypothetical protein